MGDFKKTKPIRVPTRRQMFAIIAELRQVALNGLALVGQANYQEHQDQAEDWLEEAHNKAYQKVRDMKERR